jgi:hypothetical protein
MDLFEKISKAVPNNFLFSKISLALTILCRDGILTIHEQNIIEDLFLNLQKNVSKTLFKEILLIAHEKQFKILNVLNFELKKHLLYTFLEPKTLYDLCIFNIYIYYDLNKNLFLPEILLLNINKNL